MRARSMCSSARSSPASSGGDCGPSFSAIFPCPGVEPSLGPGCGGGAPTASPSCSCSRLVPGPGGAVRVSPRSTPSPARPQSSQPLDRPREPLPAAGGVPRLGLAAGLFEFPACLDRQLPLSRLRELGELRQQVVALPFDVLLLTQPRREFTELAAVLRG